MYLNLKEKLILFWIAIFTIISGFFGLISLAIGFVGMSILYYSDKVREKIVNLIRGEKCQ